MLCENSPVTSKQEDEEEWLGRKQDRGKSVVGRRLHNV
jgi:hypothetical protein